MSTAEIVKRGKKTKAYPEEKSSTLNLSTTKNTLRKRKASVLDSDFIWNNPTKTAKEKNIRKVNENSKDKRDHAKPLIKQKEANFQSGEEDSGTLERFFGAGAIPASHLGNEDSGTLERGFSREAIHSMLLNSDEQILVQRYEENILKDNHKPRKTNGTKNSV